MLQHLADCFLAFFAVLSEPQVIGSLHVIVFQFPFVRIGCRQEVATSCHSFNIKTVSHKQHCPFSSTGFQSFPVYISGGYFVVYTIVRV